MARTHGTNKRSSQGMFSPVLYMEPTYRVYIVYGARKNRLIVMLVINKLASTSLASCFRASKYIFSPDTFFNVRRRQAFENRLNFHANDGTSQSRPAGVDKIALRGQNWRLEARSAHCPPATIITASPPGPYCRGRRLGYEEFGGHVHHGPPTVSIRPPQPESLG
jgi:hypothetical protein